MFNDFASISIFDFPRGVMINCGSLTLLIELVTTKIQLQIKNCLNQIGCVRLDKIAKHGVGTPCIIS